MTVPNPTDMTVNHKLPSLPMGVTVAAMIAFSMVYRLLALPYANIVLLSSFFFTTVVLFLKLPGSSLLYPDYPGWIVRVLLPSLGLLISLIHRVFQLPGGLFLELAIIGGFIGLSVLLSTDLFFTIRHTVESVQHRLFPLSVILTAIVSYLVFALIGYRSAGMMLAFALLLTIPVLFIVKHGIHYFFLGLSTFALAIYPMITNIPRNGWIMDILASFLVIVGFFRISKHGYSTGISAKAIYIAGGLYLCWQTISFFASEQPDMKTGIKIITGFGEMVFLFGMLLNLRTKIDLYVTLGGFITGTLLIIMMMHVNLWHTLHHFNPLILVNQGIRATVADQNPNFAIVPVISGYFLGLAFAIKKQGMAQIISILFTLVCLWAIIISGSRAAQVIVIVVSLIMTANFQKWRRAALFITIGVVALLIIAYFIDPTILKILFRTRQIDSGRFFGWRTSWDLAMQKPFLGHGPNAAIYLLSQYLGVYTIGDLAAFGGKAHNAFFSEIIESGLIGFALILMVYYCVWRWLAKIPTRPDSPWKLAAFGIFLAWIIRGVFESGGWLFIHGLTSLCYPTLLAMIIATGEILPNKEITDNTAIISPRQ